MDLIFYDALLSAIEDTKKGRNVEAGKPKSANHPFLPMGLA